FAALPMASRLPAIFSLMPECRDSLGSTTTVGLDARSSTTATSAPMVPPPMTTLRVEPGASGHCDSFIAQLLNLRNWNDMIPAARPKRSGHAVVAGELEFVGYGFGRPGRHCQALSAYGVVDCGKHCISAID